MTRYKVSVGLHVKVRGTSDEVRISARLQVKVRGTSDEGRISVWFIVRSVYLLN